MAAFSRVTPEGWTQGDDGSDSARVAPDGWEQSYIPAAGAGIVIDAPVAAATVGNEVTVSGTSDSAGDVEYRIDSGTWATLSTVTGGNFSGVITGLVAGSRTIEVRQSDNTGVTDSVSVTVVDDVINITSPVPYQLIRRGGSSTATIAVTITYTGVHTTGFQVRLNRTGAESWTDVATGASPLTFNLTGEARGYGTLEVRGKTRTDVTDSVTPVAVGRSVAIMGQSNASGRGSNNQTAPANSAYLYDGTGAFRALADPYDSNFGGSADYSALDDGASALGSFAPRLAQNFVDAGEPVLIIPVNRGGTNSAQWLPDNSTATLYGASKARINAAGGADYIVWYQGESDIDAGTAQATYESRLTSIVNELVSDFGAKVGIVKLYYDSGGTKVSERNAIRAAMQAVADADIGAVIAYDLATDNALHISSNTQLTNAGDGIYDGLMATHLVASTASLSGTVTPTGDVQFVAPFDIAGTQAASLSGSVTATGDVEYLTSLDLSAQPAALSGALSASGDLNPYPSLDLDGSQTASLSGAVTATGDIQPVVPFDLALSSATEISGQVSVTGDLFINTEPLPVPKTGAGRPSRRQRVVVEIDGEDFIAESSEEAQAILDQAKEAAEEKAKVAIERATKARNRPTRKVMADARKALELPAISAPDLGGYAEEISRQIEDIYQSAIQTIEVAALLRKRELEEEDDEDILMLL
jgi:hypothetical protein